MNIVRPSNNQGDARQVPEKWETFLSFQELRQRKGGKKRWRQIVWDQKEVEIRIQISETQLQNEEILFYWVVNEWMNECATNLCLILYFIAILGQVARFQFVRFLCCSYDRH